MIMILTILSLNIVFLLYVARRTRRERVVLEYRFRFYALRDELRRAVIRKDIEADDCFLTMDTKLSTWVDVMEDINPWLIFHKSYLDSLPEFEEREGAFRELLKSPNRKAVKRVFEASMQPLAGYVRERYWFFYWFCRFLASRHKPGNNPVRFAAARKLPNHPDLIECAMHC